VNIVVALPMLQGLAVVNGFVKPEAVFGLVPNVFGKDPHHAGKESIAPMRPRRTFMFPFTGNRVHRVKIRMILDEPFHLRLREIHCILEQLFIRIVDELNHEETAITL
jgi:hypothetical protein